jgi:DNA repair exonuclease SbcCD ATPase subunit
VRLTGIRLTDWLRFAGVSELELGPGVYALVAEYEDDPDRSNWAGKSAVVNAIRFGLFGTVPTPTLDEAIHRGADELEVELEFDDGVFISRRKRRGQSMQLEVTFPDGERELKLTQDAAQARIVEWLRLSEPDFLDTSFLAQRESAKFARATPSDRTEIVNGWMRIDPLVAACELAGGRLSKAEADERRLQARLSSLEEELRREGADGFRQLVARVEEELREAVARRDVQIADWEAWGQWSREQARANGALEAIRRAESRVASARAGLESAEATAKTAVLRTRSAPERVELAGLEQAAAEAKAQERAASEQCRAKEGLVRGEFGGECPVNGRRCPVADEINRDELAARAALASARDELARRSGERLNATARLDDARRQNEAADRAARELRESAAAMQAAKSRLAECEADRADLGEAPAVSEAIERPPRPDESEVARLEHTLERLRQSMDDHARAILEAAAASEVSATWRLAATILGRNGAQRRVVQASLGAIEAAARERLTSAGIPLDVRCVWGRPTSQPEKECSRCGQPFGTRAKKCEACGTARGKRTDGKLHLDLSDVSGAAEDLGGLAFQLAAARWLRRRRGSPWSVLVLDEPFGQLDGANRRALATSLVGLVADGYDQAFVIAHDRATLDAMPHRIRVIAGERSSRLELG